MPQWIRLLVGKCFWVKSGGCECYILTYADSHLHTCTYICRIIHNDTIINTQEDFFRKIFTSHFIVRVRKGYSRFACERELETEQKLQYFDPIVMAVSVVFLVSWCSTGGPAAQLSAGWWLSLLHLISIFSGPQLIRAPSSFGLMWLFLPYLVYNSVSYCNWNSLDFCLDWVI